MYSMIIWQFRSFIRGLVYYKIDQTIGLKRPVSAGRPHGALTYLECGSK
jgi:hypothetical protein